MRLLTFKIGQSLLALKVDEVISVGLEKSGGEPAKPGALAVDLAGALGLSSGISPHPAIIRCSHQGMPMQIKADEVLGLENIDPSKHLAWPGALSFMKKFSGVALVSGQTFLTINLDTLLPGKQK